MNTTQHEVQLKAARDRATSMSSRLINSVLKKLPHIAESSAMYALVGNALSYGTWDSKLQAQFIDQYMPETDLPNVCQALASVGLLTHCQHDDGSWYWELSDNLVSKAAECMTEALDRIPGICIPFEYVEDWKYGQTHNSLNLQLCAGNSVPSKAAIEAANRLQQVQFEVNPVVLWLLECNALQQGANPTLQAQYQLAKQVHDHGPCRFYVTFDYRGRMYYRGGLLTPQGPDWQKALFQFHAPMKLGKSGHHALAAVAATEYGSKASLQDRIDWGMENAAKHGEEIILSGKVIKSYQYSAQAVEMAWIQRHIDSGADVADYLSHIVCHADGCCNGLQHGAAMTGSRSVAQLTNCTAATRNDSPNDAYTAALNSGIEALTGYPRAQAALLGAGRNSLKYPVMVVSYGAGEQTCYKAFCDWATDEQISGLRTGTKKPEQLIYKAVGTVAGPIIALNAAMKKAVAETQKLYPCPIMWEASDGFLVVQECRSKDKKDKRYLGAGEFKQRTDGISAKAQEAAIGPNYVHTRDSDHCREVVRSVSYSVVTVHDSIGCHAGSFWHCAGAIRRGFVTIYEFDQAESFRLWNNVDFKVPQLGDYHPSECLKAPYFFL